MCFGEGTLTLNIYYFFDLLWVSPSLNFESSLHDELWGYGAMEMCDQKAALNQSRDIYLHDILAYR